MSDLVACPFCREMFAKGEATSCPACGLALVHAAKLPPRADEEHDDFGIPLRPDLATLPFAYAGRGRGVLAACAVLGLAAFFLPWVHRTAPDVRVLSAFDLARNARVVWAVATAWFVLLPVALSRRSIDRMRGARVAAAGLAVIPGVVATMLLTHPPKRGLVPIAFTWGPGVWITIALAVVATIAGARFGGRADDVAVEKGRARGRTTLH